MKSDHSLYIRVLIWAYNKGQKGFTKIALREELGLDHDSFAWVHNLFFRGTNNDRALIELLYNREGKEYYMLSDKGMSAAVDYLELKEAHASGRRATYIAIGSVIIGVVVGIAQIIVQIYYK